MVHYAIFSRSFELGSYFKLSKKKVMVVVDKTEYLHDRDHMRQTVMQCAVPQLIIA